MGLEQAIDGRFGHEVALLIGKAHRQLARRQLGLLKRHVDDLALNLGADAVPDPDRPGRTILQRLGTTFEIAVIPAIEGAPCNAELIQRLLRWQV